MLDVEDGGGGGGQRDEAGVRLLVKGDVCSCYFRWVSRPCHAHWLEASANCMHHCSPFTYTY